MRFLFVVACLAAVATANVQSGARVNSVARRTERQVVEVAPVSVVAAAVKAKPVAASKGLLSKDLTDKLQLAALFAVWYAFNAGCEYA